MTNLRFIAVIDIGKTNAKLAMVDLQTLTEIDVITRPNLVLPGPPWPHFDTEGQWQFLLEGLREFHSRYGIEGISITTHGASAALLGEDGTLAAPILDYEHDGPDELAAQYDVLRAPFEETGSPRLPGGLNVGAQLHWQFHTAPGLRDRVRWIVTYPQYWAHRLTGIAATDVTSIGCHTDLWNPMERKPSSVVDSLGIRDKLAPVYASADILGPVLPAIASETGLSPDTPVVCGIHDSNASLYPHILTQKSPFSVVSTGTWVIAMSTTDSAPKLDPARDALINVNALGAPVPSVRFMGGREFELIQQNAPAVATAQDVDDTLSQDIMLLPAVVPGCGPFPDHSMKWLPSEPELASGPREIALSFYLALVTAECLQITGSQGPIVVEGPFAKNQAYQDMLEAVTGQPLVISASATGTSIGAALLFGASSTPKPGIMRDRISPKVADRMRSYSAKWREATRDLAKK